MIELKNVTKRYGSFVAVENFNFKIEDGEIIGLLGPNGAGKSTTMNMLTGYTQASEGEIIINGLDIMKKPKQAKKEIGYMPENVPLYTELTPKEFIKYMAELKLVPKKEINEHVEKLLKDIGLTEVQNKLIKNLSRGYKQRVSLAGSLAGNPKILILDEPTVGLDPKQITDIRKLIKELGKNHTVILSSHILSEVSQICSKVIIINKGKIIAIDTPENLETKMQKKNLLNLIVEDNENKMEEIKQEIENIDEIKLIGKQDDNTKQYQIICKTSDDIRKSLFASCAKIGITILEMKKIETSLEDVFIELTSKEEEGGEK